MGCPYCDSIDRHESEVAKNLVRGADTFEGRHSLYGNNYKRFGQVMLALFPNGIPLNSVEDGNRLGLFIQICSKVTRYAENMSRGGHVDSAHDLMVYAAMIEEITDEEVVPF
jgi:thiol-disulfide isomerase/thioredoxin